MADSVRMLPISTPEGEFRVWTQRVGANPDVKVLVLHGGPGATHEYLANLGDHLPAAGFEIFFYDQLGSGRSDRPDEPDLWELDRFVNEVEQVRQALGLDRTNLVLYGQSWGGLLAMEYALRHQEHLRGLIVSNMMSSCPGVQRLRGRRPHAGHGPGRPCRDQGLRSPRRNGRSPIR